MTRTYYNNKIADIHRSLRCQISYDNVKETFTDNGMDQNKCFRVLEKKLLENQNNRRPGSSKKQLTIEEKKSMLRKEIFELYEKKRNMDEGPKKRELRALIDRTVINWNLENYPFGFFDLHWMTPNGAADFVVKTLDGILENNAGFKKELKFVVGIGKNSLGQVAATLKKEVCLRLDNHPRRAMFTWRTMIDNEGMIKICFK